MAQQSTRYSVPTGGRTLVARTASGVLVASAVLIIAKAIVDALAVDVGAIEGMSPFAVGPLLGTTILAGVGATLVYAGLITFTDRPVRNFVVVAAAVFGFMLLPVVFFTPSMGVTPAGQALLVLYHLLVAVPLVVFIVGAFEL